MIAMGRGKVSMKETKELRNLINSEKLGFNMEAHNGLSAKLLKRRVLKEFGSAAYRYLRRWE